MPLAHNPHDGVELAYDVVGRAHPSCWSTEAP